MAKTCSREVLELRTEARSSQLSSVSVHTSSLERKKFPKHSLKNGKMDKQRIQLVQLVAVFARGAAFLKLVPSDVIYLTSKSSACCP